MHVLIAPHSLGPLLPSTTSAEQFLTGWNIARPDDVLQGLPLSDGSDGYLETLAPLGHLDAMTVPGAHGGEVPIGLVRTGTGVAYLTTESWTREDGTEPFTASSLGVGHALGDAIRGGARRIVLAAGDTAWHDAGTGLLRGLAQRLEVVAENGWEPVPFSSPEAIGGGEIDLLEPLRRALSGIDFVVAAQGEAPLLGLHGTGAELASRGIDAAAAQALEARTSEFIAASEQAAQAWAPRSLLPAGERRPSRRPYSGAGGGVAFILSLLGARVLPGAWVVAEELGLKGALERVDLVLTGARILADRELSHGVVAEVGTRAEPHAIPVVAIGGRIDATPRQLATVGVHAAYPVINTPPGVLPDLDLVTPDALRERAGRVARNWSR